MGERKPYSTDLTNEQWSHLQILLPKARGKGRRRSRQQQRKLINAMLYLVHTGCQWRELPHDFPPWSTVHGYFLELRRSGVWAEINDFLRRGVREQVGRDPDPSVVIVDSQSIKTTEKKETVAVTTVESG
jgi:transposase